jgi:hypothetical protein
MSFRTTSVVSTALAYFARSMSVLCPDVAVESLGSAATFLPTAKRQHVEARTALRTDLARTTAP